MHLNCMTFKQIYRTKDDRKKTVVGCWKGMAEASAKQKDYLMSARTATCAHGTCMVEEEGLCMSIISY